MVNGSSSLVVITAVYNHQTGGSPGPRTAGAKTLDAAAIRHRPRPPYPVGYHQSCRVERLSASNVEKTKSAAGDQWDIDPMYMQLSDRADAGHAKQEDKRYLNFCEAQMVWDKSMAWKLIEHQKKYLVNTTIVPSGAHHAWKRASGAGCRDASFTYRVILPLIRPDRAEICFGSRRDYVVL